MSSSAKLTDENTEIVSINTDGNCLFRSLVTYVSKELYNCRRNRSGVPSNRSLQSKEINLANSLRFFVVNYIERNKDKYKDEIAYDSEFYNNIDDRIKNMFKSGEYGGILEINIASELLKLAINVYVINEEEYNLVYNVGNYDQTCNLLLDEDHYEILKISEENRIELPEIKIPKKNKSKLVVTNSYVPKFQDDAVKCMPFSMTSKKTFKETKEGIYIYDKTHRYRRSLKKLGEGCSKKLEEGWFFWDNITDLQSWAEDNNILWLN